MKINRYLIHWPACGWSMNESCRTPHGLNAIGARCLGNRGIARSCLPVTGALTERLMRPVWCRCGDVNIQRSYGKPTKSKAVGYTPSLVVRSSFECSLLAPKRIHHTHWTRINSNRHSVTCCTTVECGFPWKGLTPTKNVISALQIACFMSQLVYHTMDADGSLTPQGFDIAQAFDCFNAFPCTAADRDIGSSGHHPRRPGDTSRRAYHTPPVTGPSPAHRQRARRSASLGSR